MKGDRITLDMSLADAAAIVDALSYYTMAAHDNFGAGWPDKSVYEDDERLTYDRVEKIEKRLAERVEARQRPS